MSIAAGRRGDHVGLSAVARSIRVEIALGFVVLLMLGNLRGIRESGRIFAVPTYFFIVSILGDARASACGATSPARCRRRTSSRIRASATGLLADVRAADRVLERVHRDDRRRGGVERRARVPSAREPERRRHARRDGRAVDHDVHRHHAARPRVRASFPNETETVISQLARATFGGGDAPYYFAVQAATMLILVLAANTAYADFPRLASIVARDRFLPRQFTNQGDRLAFSNGILILSVLAAVLLVAFGGDTHALIPLYMIGVFVSFTLSQAGMVIHWRRVGAAGLADERVRSTASAPSSPAIVLVIVAVTKAAEGAWIIILMIPALVVLFTITRRHYDHVASELTLRDWQPERAGPPRGAGADRRHPARRRQGAAVRAHACRPTCAPCTSRSIRRRPRRCASSGRRGGRAWSWSCSTRRTDRCWSRCSSTSRRSARDESVDGYITVILPEFVPRRLWQHLLHNQHALLIKGALLFKPNVVVTSVPFTSGVW